MTVLEFLKDHDLISINRLEKRAGIPQYTISLALRGLRKLPKKHEKKLIKLLTTYGYKNNSTDNQ